MKLIKIVFLLLTSVLVFGSCKKDPVSTERKSYLKMKVDGVLKEYDTCLARGMSQPALNETYYQLNIMCGVPDDYTGVSVNDIKPITKGTYTATAANPAAGNPMAGLGTYKTPGDEDSYISVYAGWPLYEVTVTFTEFNDKYITGSFNGKMRGIENNKVITVTEGTFKALRN